MPRYRMYKNGIFGCRYKGLYIVKEEENKTYSVLDSKKIVLKENMKSYSDCEWEIDKITASPELEKLLKDLYGKNLYVLGNYLAELSDKDDEGLSTAEKELYQWIIKIRKRKSLRKEY